MSHARRLSSGCQQLQLCGFECMCRLSITKIRPQEIEGIRRGDSVEFRVPASLVPLLL
jgi:hypothetical protein